MARKKKKTKSLLPKRIAGVKVPRALRKGRAGRFLTSPLGLALLSEAAMAASAAYVAKKGTEPSSAVRRLASAARDEMESLATEARARGQASSEVLKEAFAAASAAFAARLHQTAEAIDPPKKAAARPETRAAH